MKLLLAGANPLQLSPPELDGLADDLRAEGFEVEISLGLDRAPHGAGVTWWEVIEIIAVTEGCLQAIDRLVEVVKRWQDRRLRPQSATIRNAHGEVASVVERKERNDIAPHEEYRAPEGSPPYGHPEWIEAEGVLFYRKRDGHHGRADCLVHACNPEHLDAEMYRSDKLSSMDVGTELDAVALLPLRFTAEHADRAEGDWGSMRLSSVMKTGAFRVRVELQALRPGDIPGRTPWPEPAPPPPPLPEPPPNLDAREIPYDETEKLAKGATEIDMLAMFGDPERKVRSDDHWIYRWPAVNAKRKKCWLEVFVQDGLVYGKNTVWPRSDASEAP